MTTNVPLNLKDTDLLLSMIDIEITQRKMLEEFDRLWRDGFSTAPGRERVRLILGQLRIRCAEQAVVNAKRNASPFMRASMRVTGTTPTIQSSEPQVTSEPTESQKAHEALREARRKRLSK